MRSKDPRVIRAAVKSFIQATIVWLSIVVVVGINSQLFKEISILALETFYKQKCFWTFCEQRNSHEFCLNYKKGQNDRAHMKILIFELIYVIIYLAFETILTHLREEFYVCAWNFKCWLRDEWYFSHYRINSAGG